MCSASKKFLYTIHPYIISEIVVSYMCWYYSIHTKNQLFRDCKDGFFPCATNLLKNNVDEVVSLIHVCLVLLKRILRIMKQMRAFSFISISF